MSARPELVARIAAADRLAALKLVRERLEKYVFRPTNEADLQSQVFTVLAEETRFKISREVVAARGRYDLFVWYSGDSQRPTALVLELKLAGSPASVERQAQRYALTEGVDIVAVVTTSIRLGRRLLEQPAQLGGKPFGVVVLRTS